MERSLLFIQTLFLLLCQTCCVLYNENAVIKFSPEYGANDHSYFGYSVVLRDAPNPAVYIGAPRDTSNYINHAKIQDPGVIYKCEINLSQSETSCEQFVIDISGNDQFRLGNGKSFHHRKDQMWLGMTMDGSMFNNGTLVMCAPRWVNQLHMSYHLGNGLCYTLSDTLPHMYKAQVLSLTPLIDKFHQGFEIPNRDDQQQSSYLYAYGEAGISAKLSQDQTELLIGAPGVFTWTGTVIRYRIVKTNTKNDYYMLKNIPNPYYTTDFHETIYFGYSVDSGKFISNRPTLYVAGAPRGADYKGQVFIFDFPLREVSGYVIFGEFQGIQIGEYFGASIAAIDINNDGLTDLLVGAPLFALPLTADVGRVDVFINHDKGKFVKQESLIVGRSMSGARFGSTFSSLGDINDDGYTDVAIAAPYEDGGKGAVYIYFGSSSGLHETFVQRIARADTSGFGISISKGIDVDNNLCNDIVIGAHESANAFLYRCNSPLDVSIAMMSNPLEIGTNTKNITVTACFRFKNKGYLRLGLTANISIDSQYKRASLRNFEDRQFNVSNADYIYEKCKEFIIDFNSTGQDLSRPIDVEIKYDSILDPSKALKFCEDCAILHPLDEKHKLLRIPFMMGCGAYDVCKPDLVISVDVNKSYVIGSSSSLEVVITLMNIGEPAFLPVVRIPLDEKIPLFRVPPRCHVDDSILICKYKSPLRNSTQDSIVVQFDTTLLKSTDKNILFNLTSSSGGEEVNVSNNNIEMNVDLIPIYKFEIIGQPTGDKFMYIEPTSSNIPNISISHAFEITNKGPTSTSDIFIEVFVPFSFQSEKSSEIVPLIETYEYKTLLDSQPLLCFPESGIYNINKLEGHGFDITNDTSTESSNDYTTESSQADGKSTGVQDSVYPQAKWNTVLPTEDTNETDSTLVSGFVNYQIIRCSGPGLVAGISRAIFVIKMKFNNTNIEKLIQNEKALVLSTLLKVDQRDADDSNTNLWTSSIIIGKPPPPSGVSLWIIILAIVLGLLVFIIITFVLYKLGFFKRKTQEELQLLKSQERSKADFDDLTDTERD